MAQQVLSDVPPIYRKDFNYLVHTLSQKFEPKNQSELYRAQIKKRLRRRGEPFSYLAHEIKKLIRYAYPDTSLDVRERLARDCFIDSLNDQEIEWAVHQGRPRFVDHTVNLALEFEAFQNIRKQRMYQKQAGVRMQQMSQNTNMSSAFLIRHISQNSRIFPNDRNKIKFNNQSKNNGKCHYCGYKGHFIKDCRKRLYDLKNCQKEYKTT